MRSRCARENGARAVESLRETRGPERTQPRELAFFPKRTQARAEDGTRGCPAIFALRREPVWASYPAGSGPTACDGGARFFRDSPSAAHMDSMEFNTRAHGFHGFHGIHGADVRSMVVISPKHLTRERTGVMAYRAGSARVSTDRSRMTAGVRFCGSHRLAHPVPTRAHFSSWRSQKSFLGLEIGDGDPLKTARVRCAKREP